MPDVDIETAAPVLDPLFELKKDSDEVGRLVCCRDVSWRRAFCGEPADYLMATAQSFCRMCLETADGLLPGWRSQEPPLCPIDGRHCPGEDEVDAEIERRSLPYLPGAEPLGSLRT